MTAPNASLDKHSLRTQIRAQRRRLSSQEQNNAAQRLANHARAYAPLYRAQTIAAYQAFQGEIATDYLLNSLPYRQLVLPKITSFLHSTMRFYPSAQTKLSNRYGIDEPAGLGAPIDLRQVDVVFVPLVCFDRSGNRMGMGAGFYDRALSFRRNPQRVKRPLLVGLAHSFQEVNALSPQPWDVPLDAIITEQELITVTK